MGSWHKVLIFGAAIIAATASADAHMGGMGGTSGGGFHGFHGGHSRPLLFHFHQHNFGVPFPNASFGRARFEGWSGGPYSVGVAGFDDDQDGDFAPEDLHFRVQERFGPGDIGRPTPPPPQPYDYGPWEGARSDPWHGYDSDD